MAKSGSTSNSGGTLNVIIKTVVPAAVTLAANGIGKIQDKAMADECVAVPELFTKGYPLTLNQAMDVLSNRGLKAIAIEMPIENASAKYRGYFASQVVGSKPKPKQKVKPGEIVCVQYVTQEFIDESQRLFDEIERKKQEAKTRKADVKESRRMRRKQAVSDTVDMVQDGMGRIFKHKKKR